MSPAMSIIPLPGSYFRDHRAEPGVFRVAVPPGRIFGAGRVRFLTLPFMFPIIFATFTD